ncbi:MAG: hypothetical protein MEQ07_11745, partial [Aquimonas sp.]|nr:hypothetical protein [Aquimonas sp.]
MSLFSRVLLGLGLALAAGASQAQVERCVRTIAELNSAWLLAKDDPVTIKLATGVYDFAQFNDSGISYRLRVRGGYNSVCTSRTEDPSATILTHSTGGEIRMIAYIGGGAPIEFERLTFRAAGGVSIFLENINSNDHYILLDRVWADQTRSFRVQTGAEVFVRNSVFTRNSECALSIAVGSSGTLSWFEKAVISNSTFADNVGGGLCIGGDNIEDDWELALTNSVFWNNAAADISLRNPNISFSTIDATLRNNTYTAIQSNRALRSTPAATSSANPQFVNAAAGNWRLSGASPAINSGRIDANLLNQRDFDGGPRWFGQAPDRGAFESNIGTTATVLSVTN